ncbi:MAG: hypothetical protein ACMXYF_02695 [Candidatus Woesearchaeota archaeon]
MMRLNAKQTKNMYAILYEQYAYEQRLSGSLYINKEQKIFLFVDQPIDFESLRVNSFGLYIGEYNDDHTQMRLSIEGSQLIGPHAQTNCLVLDDEYFTKWICGQDIQIDESLEQQVHQMQGYIIICNKKNDFCGCARLKNGMLLNFVPKIRRLKTVVESA